MTITDTDSDNPEILRCQGYVIVPRKYVAVATWNAYVDVHPDGWWWHRTEWLDYCLAYAGGMDHSVAVMGEGKIVALMPLLEEHGHFKGGRNPLAVRLANEQEDILFILAGYEQQVAQRREILTGEFMGRALPIMTDSISIPEIDIAEHIENMSFQSRVVNLTVPKEQLKNELRKSYKQFVNKHDFIGGDHTLFEAYQLLHQERYQCARSPQTYEVQKQWCQVGLARVYVIPSETSQVRLADAASLWIIYKGHAYYASGVYTGQNLAHDLMWAALNDLARMGVRTAELGWQGVARTEKERNIEFFKRGFGGEDWHVLAVRMLYGTMGKVGTA